MIDAVSYTHLSELFQDLISLFIDCKNFILLVRDAHKASWDTFVNRVEHGRPDNAYKLMSNFNREERDTAQMSIIPKDSCINHYKSLRYDAMINEELEDNERTEVDLIELNEFIIFVFIFILINC